jgi:hypothetical protein
MTLPEEEAAGRLPAGEKERLRSEGLEMVQQGQMTLKRASAMLRVSYRQTKRLYAVYQQQGDAGLTHGNYGRRSNNRTAEAIVERAVQRFWAGARGRKTSRGGRDGNQRKRAEAASYSKRGLEGETPE